MKVNIYLPLLYDANWKRSLKIQMVVNQITFSSMNNCTELNYALFPKHVMLIEIVLFNVVLLEIA